ncbi:MAG: serine--tRNA ligase [Candidatus Omnitrophica bacterium]|nr:serine--tRNA ligase [Candidatus Omnitrophota bacterium]
MLDIKFIRQNSELVKEAIAAKREKFDLDSFLTLDAKRRKMLQEIEALKAEQNRAASLVGRLKKENKPAEEEIEKSRKLAERLSLLQQEFVAVKDEFEKLLLQIPNLPHASVPRGGKEKNQIVREAGTRRTFSFEVRNHIELGKKLGILDFERAAKICGSHFTLFKGEGALLERALINFMLDLHTQKHGYQEAFVPFLANVASMTATAQLPKLEEDMYRLRDDDYFLIPTAEVPLTNIHRDEILEEKSLPLAYTAYSACFRREAGSYGKDTKGLLRVHQFDKVELVRFAKPQDSYGELEIITAHAEEILKQLGLPYRVVLLASGDMSFASSKTYDLEVYAPGVDRWLEVSSCSNFEDFQARRANIRYRTSGNKLSFVHTLNGSGLALARLVIAILENYQQEKGEIKIPEVLQPYMHGITVIKPKQMG